MKEETKEDTVNLLWEACALLARKATVEQVTQQLAHGSHDEFEPTEELILVEMERIRAKREAL